MGLGTLWTIGADRVAYVDAHLRAEAHCHVLRLLPGWPSRARDRTRLSAPIRRQRSNVWNRRIAVIAGRGDGRRSWCGLLTLNCQASLREKWSHFKTWRYLTYQRFRIPREGSSRTPLDTTTLSRNFEEWRLYFEA